MATKALPPIAQARRAFFGDDYWDVRILGRWYRVQANSQSDAYALVRLIRSGKITEAECQGQRWPLDPRIFEAIVESPAKPMPA